MLEIEEVFVKAKKLILPFETIREAIGTSRCKLTGTLSSNKKIFQRVSKNVWRYIPDETDTIDSMCAEMGLSPLEIKDFIKEGGMLQYSYVRIKKSKGKYSKRQFYYMVHVMKKDAVLSLDPDYLVPANGTEFGDD